MASLIHLFLVAEDMIGQNTQESHRLTFGRPLAGEDGPLLTCGSSMEEPYHFSMQLVTSFQAQDRLQDLHIQATDAKQVHSQEFASRS